jgi:hypothetical protein
MTLFLTFSILAVLASAVVAYRAVVAMQAVTQKQSETMESLASALAQTKGLTPHQAAPALYSPGGVSWDAVERGRQAIKAQEKAPAVAAVKVEAAKVSRAIAILEDRERTGEQVDAEHLKELRTRKVAFDSQLKQLEEVNG